MTRSRRWLVSFTALVLISAIVLLGFVRSFPFGDSESPQFSPPSYAHLLGTDQFGRDVLNRLLLGSTRTLVAAGVSTVVALLIGLAVGAISAGMGGWVDWLLMRFVDVILAVPGLLLAMALATALGADTSAASLGVGVGLMPGIARLTRTATQTTMSAPYIESAFGLGAGRIQIIKKHLIPNILPQVLPQAGVLFAWSVLSISGLEYLGLVGSPSDPSWGRMIAEGRNYLLIAPWISIAPGAAIMLTTFGFMQMSDVSGRVRKRKMSPEDGDTFP